MIARSSLNELTLVYDEGHYLGLLNRRNHLVVSFWLAFLTVIREIDMNFVVFFNSKVVARAS